MTTAPPPAGPSGPVQQAEAADFAEEAVLRGLTHRTAYTPAVGPMERQYAGGAASGDVDGDDDLDLVVVGGDGHANRLYLNNGSGSFTESAAAAGIAFTKSATENHPHSGPALADMDGDGDLDLFLGGLGGAPSMIFENDGSGAFSDATAGSGLEFMTSVNSISAAFGDYDLDGDLDLALAHWGTPRDQDFPGETETLWRNDSDSSGIRFTAVSAPANISAGLDLGSTVGVLGEDHDYSFAPSFVDLDGDRYPELLMVADFGTSNVFRNNGDGTFSKMTDRAVINDSNGMGSAVGDYDRDGDFDWFVSSINGNRLYENTDGDFATSSVYLDIESGGWGWGSCFADFNADGYTDIYQTNGWFANDPPGASDYQTDPSHLWMNSGGRGFSDLAGASNMLDRKQGRAVVCDDFTGDGAVDALLLTYDQQQQQYLWVNQQTDHNFLKVRLEGLPPNTQGIGARVAVSAGGATQYGLVTINSGFTAHGSTEQLFGLGDADTVSGVEVIWPDGLTSIIANPAANSTLTIRHPSL
ncbi:CRTAC1 family protein [Parvularcula lutaonensis]|uniref:CRTAC1 family protein n=1 Tax=Parvularcula lutaonensis TaxID=491923 RepID=A0ABV7MF34_9PROT|nr:CRTAC1 family protein [Parvularcula lutaonensis]GGY52044.1 hypothetical protein GCM10007148_21330 [Parvularcula lutaonensis]